MLDGKLCKVRDCSCILFLTLFLLPGAVPCSVELLSGPVRWLCAVQCSPSGWWCLPVVQQADAPHLPLGSLLVLCSPTLCSEFSAHSSAQLGSAAPPAEATPPAERALWSQFSLPDTLPSSFLCCVLHTCSCLVSCTAAYLRGWAPDLAFALWPRQCLDSADPLKRHNSMTEEGCPAVLPSWCSLFQKPNEFVFLWVPYGLFHSKTSRSFVSISFF